jgi:integrase
MEIASPSRTALGVAVRRACHQIHDSSPLVLDDPIAVAILGDTYRQAIEDSATSINDRSSLAIGIEAFGAHDLRRTCAKLCRNNGDDLEQIKFLLGHSSIQTTERYLASDQEIAIAVNDKLRPG